MTDSRQLTVVEGAHSHAWSPDGKHVSVVWSDDSRGMGVSIVDIGDDGAMTDVRELEIDPEYEIEPMWAPDGSQLAFELRKDGSIRVGVADPDRTGVRLFDPEMADAADLDLTWAPDGRTLVLGGVEDWLDPTCDCVRLAQQAWSIDVSTGEDTEISTPVHSWQRLAP
jgi:Tol biopolymer transport system component